MNPFILNTYYSEDFFIGREHETRKIIDTLSKNKNIGILSKRRLGKTTLVKHVQNKYKHDVSVNFIYMDIMSSMNISEFTMLLAESVFNSGLRNNKQLTDTFSKLFSKFKPTFSINPLNGNTRFNLDLTNQKENLDSLEIIFDYIENSDKKFILAIDEFQQISKYEEDYIDFFKTKINSISNLVCIFAGSNTNTISNIFTQENNPFIDRENLIVLRPLKRRFYQKFAVQMFKNGGKSIDENLVDDILDLVNNNTYYAQLMCHRLYNLDTEEITITDIYKVFVSIIEENKFYFENYINLLTAYQWKVLRAIARENNAKEVTSISFCNRYQLSAPSSVNTAIKSLLKKDIINKEDGLYSVQDVLFAKWLSMA